MKIKQKLSLLFSSLLLVGVSAVAYVALQWASAQERHNALNNLDTSVQLSAQHLYAELLSTRAMLDTLANTDLFDGMNPDRFLPRLKLILQQQQGRYEKFIVGLPDGSFYNTAGGNPYRGGLRSLDDSKPDAPLHFINQRDYWRATVGDNPKAEARFYVSQPMISYTTGVRQVVLARTLLSTDGKVIGLLGVSTEWRTIEQFIQQVQDDYFEPHPWPTRMLLTDRDGNYWYHWNRSKIVRPMVDETGRPRTGKGGQTLSLISNIKDENIPALSGLFEFGQSSDEAITTFSLPGQSDTYYLIHHMVPGSDYMLGVVVSQSELLSSLDSLKRNYLWLLLAVGVSGLVLARLLASHIAHPIEALTRHIEAMSEGEPLAKDQNWRLSEVADLARAFDDLHQTVLARERALAESESRLNYAMQGANDGLWDWNLATNDVFYSPRWFTMLGRDRDDHPQDVSTFLALLHPDDAEKTNHAIEDYLSGASNSYRIQLRLQHKDGHYVHVLSRAFAVRDDEGKPIRLVGTHVDISEQVAFEEKIQQLNDELEKRVRLRTADLETAKEAALQAQAEAEESSLAKSRFLANMSHELRTPLNAINGFSERLLERLGDQLEARHLDALQTIARNGRQLLAMINDILDTQRIHSGEIRLNHSQIMIPELIDKLAREHQHERKPGVDFLTRYDPDVEQRILHADPARLGQILSNLLSNAFKFTESGSVSLIASTTSRRGRAGMRFEVIDTGPGIPPALLDKLFNPFTQLDDSLSRAQQGTGLGLALVKLITELHHGEVKVFNQEPRGTRFEVWIPDSQS